MLSVEELAKVVWAEDRKSMLKMNIELEGMGIARCAEAIEEDAKLTYEDANHEHFERIALAVARRVIEEAAKLRIESFGWMRTGDFDAVVETYQARIRSLLASLEKGITDEPS